MPPSLPPPKPPLPFPMTNCLFVDRLKVLGVLCLTRADVKAYRDRFGLRGLCDAHHVIPRSCRMHPTVVALGYDVEGAGNFALLPSERGGEQLLLRDRAIHSGGHMEYNRYVWSSLDSVPDEDSLCRLVHLLHRRVRHDPNVPWN